MECSVEPLRFAGVEMRGVKHACAFFNSAAEQYRALLPLIVSGLESGERAVHVVEPHQHDDHLRRLSAAGVDVEGMLTTGQLALKSTFDTYLHEGDFNQESMIEFFTATSTSTSSDSRTRFVCQMDWVADGDRQFINNVIEFEARINSVWERRDDITICVYDLAKFSSATVLDVLRTHPMVVVGSVLQENPFYIAPAQYLPVLHARHSQTSDQG
jgi:hypothetical protein